MPEIELSSEERTSNIFDVDKLRLKKDEKARILVLSEKPMAQFCHYVTDGSSFNDDGSPRGQQYFCLGDYATVLKEKSDPERCPACVVASDGNGAVVKTATRRLILNVARYRTRGNGVIPPGPISLTHAVWIFSNDKFNTLQDIKSEYGDISKRDLSVECTAEKYQNMKIMPLNGAAVSKDKPALEQLKEIKANLPKDVERLLGRRISFEEMEKLVGGESDEIDEAEVESILEGLDTEVEESESPFEVDETGVETIDLDDLLKD